jgi:intracellular sulfur oxidation DsrE/DsrF family protein
MKRFILAACLLACSFFTKAQSVPYNVVFDLTSNDSTDQKAVLRWINGIAATRPDARLEVVLYGQSLGMVTAGKSVVVEGLQQALQNKNVSVKVCEIAMKRHQLDKSQLLPGVGTVPDGIYEIISKQKEGWGYIKAAH